MVPLKEKIIQTTLAVEELKVTLPELLDSMRDGDEVILTRNNLTVAKLVSEVSKTASKHRPGPGLCKGMITYMAPDFNAPLEDMKEYVE